MQHFKNFSKFVLSCLLVLLSHVSLAQEKTSSSDFKISDKALKAYVGEYIFDQKSAFGFDITISLDGTSRLMAQPSDKSQPLALMSAIAEDKFELIRTGGLVAVFERNQKGEILSLTLSESRQSEGEGIQSFKAIRKKE